jgi:hypothetical protein
MPINLDDNKEKNRLRINSRKKSCDSNSSNLSEIFQKTLNSHLNKRNEENPHNNNSTISTTTSISGSSNNEDQKNKKEYKFISY